MSFTGEINNIHVQFLKYYYLKYYKFLCTRYFNNNKINSVSLAGVKETTVYKNFKKSL